MTGRNMFWSLLLLHLTTLILCSPVSKNQQRDDDFDVSDDYENSLPKYDFKTLLKNDVTEHPLVSGIASRVESALKANSSKMSVIYQDEDGSNKSSEVSDEDLSTFASGDQTVMSALMELEHLSKLLELKWEYIDSRKKEDPTWPTGLSARIGTDKATEEDKNKFEYDLYQAISGLVLMKMMEERLAFVNKYVDNTLANNPGTDLKLLFGGEDKVQAAEGLLALKYLEGFLHATNGLITEVLSTEEYDTGKVVAAEPIVTTATFPILPDPQDINIQPLSPYLNDDVDVSTFVFLIFSVVGFFFVLFIILYALLRCIKQCSGMDEVFSQKSKYERL